MNHKTIHPHAQAAVRAAQLRRSIGAWAAWRYCDKRGVPFDLFTLACVLENARRAGL